ncbi:2-succinyl-5-enolpyruvyl-6-hydroxy-3-cyclohexene-1-carboxylic-acid synthase [Accumulibacter sp.]|uniref:2-succinyl-5-enolpyruvyl-6-hydroxy-3- cyclohexene-1-carboxylic-acid synthase n=1 Tax=Accumulibacter sp. TaxID=2053492 RepID=UPI0025F58737|nr:2-succinyl-5-enolpyruvyl-6-hydroxy-3-cyclohexene-1-carboxylic-acid synthase [Accumulibacter sp.]MCM8613496.1 2-succinyl-5-enolpyruvyl-6-hydroxy-3-cyclohexene-1-carboxylic-acid synthase [Accumulibacter sp.]MCM8637189.1 2-succinyl-5-enolpyruvyl-6-hydroxy-3-cyclohexene-1-carboxylic-acid synthase [Accumulibacter sp.]MCM8640747.1 2-succinyl-5-enolpyruvyl-6-hydroxy-3-cyclohexene-1-carboxylic-acid synthase [Accumulibacter sp.]
MTQPQAHGLLNLRYAQALVDGLRAAGLRDLVLSPGSRSSPLALAFLRQPAISSHVLVDERSAAFLALGIAKAARRPVALLATSGSAVANWLPAVVEADLAAVPLLLLSADRPPELVGWGASQTIDQQRLFGAHLRACHAPGPPAPDFAVDYLRSLARRVLGECCSPLPGPVQLNLAFREPLLPAGALATGDVTGGPAVLAVGRPRLLPDRQLVADSGAAISGRPGVIVCGGDDNPPAFAAAVCALARQLDCPLLAEPLSNLRFGGHDRSRICVHYDAFLRPPSPLAARRPEWLLRCGSFPVTRTLQEWLRANRDARQIVLAADGRWRDPLHCAAVLIQGDPLAVLDDWQAMPLRAAAPDWRGAFLHAERQVAALAAAWRSRDDFEGALIPALLDELPAGHRVFCGNSLPIRDLDAFSGGGEKVLQFFGNRGVSGIDGNLSTALGVASTGPCVALLGDLTLQHDLAALAAAGGRDIVVVVINNGGGGIFEYLPMATLPEFERAWLTPQKLDFVAAAAAFGVAGERCASLGGFACALRRALQRGGPTLLEVPIDRRRSVAQHRAFWQEAAAVAGGLPAMP